MKKMFLGLSALLLPALASAATPMDINFEAPAFLKSRTGLALPVQVQETSRSTDLNQTLHIRVQQTYQGYRVLGGDGIVHIPRAGVTNKALLEVMTPATTMNGRVYENLQQDLVNAPAYIFAAAQKDKALTTAIGLYREKSGRTTAIQNSSSELVVYVDDNNKAHWAFVVKFFVPAVRGEMPANPVYIMDAATLNVYTQWNDLKTFDAVEAGGLGGNHKTGKKVFDGLQGDLPSFTVQRDPKKQVCRMQNKDVVLKDAQRNGEIVTIDCKTANPEHNNVYWDENFDAVLTTYSPTNDVMFGATITSKMFNEWYKMPMLAVKGKPLFLPITVHDPIENAYWQNNSLTFGDSTGSDTFNPFTSLDTVAHEIGHGFTEKHSNLGANGSKQGFALNEAFSDMAGITAEYYAYGETKYLVGWGDMKGEGIALRYMEKPSKDCEWRNAAGYEGCSIDDMSQYSSSIEEHLLAGIFNRVYYQLAQAWTPKDAFAIMVKANTDYWRPSSGFADAACGVVYAARDLKYDGQVVAKAFDLVKISLTKCKKAS